MPKCCKCGKPSNHNIENIYYCAEHAKEASKWPNQKKYIKKLMPTIIIALVIVTAAIISL